MTRFFGYAFLCMAGIWLIVSLAKLIADMVAKKKSKSHVEDCTSSTSKQCDIESVDNADHVGTADDK